MKKIIAISVMFALVAGAVFADVSMGGDFGYKWDVLKGDNGKVYSTDKDPKAPAGADTNLVPPLGYANPVKSGTSFVSARVDFNFSGDNYGGKVRLYAAGSQGWWGSNPFAFVWWKPVDIFQFQLGHNADGNWGAAQITGWGFNANAQDFVAIDNDNAGNTTWLERNPDNQPTKPTWPTTPDVDSIDKFNKDLATYNNYKYYVAGGEKGGGRNRAWKAARAYGFYGGYSDVGALFSIYPVDILTVNIALPANAGHSAGTVDAEDLFKKAHLNVVAKVGDIGTARLSFVGKGGTKTTKKVNADNSGFVSEKSYGSTGDIWASFYLAAVENLGLDVGVGYHLPYDTPGAVGSLSSTTTNGGVEVGIGATYKVSDDFGVKARIGAKLLTETKTVRVGGYSSTAQTNYGLGILPYFNLGGPTVYFNAGFGIDSYEDKSVGPGYSRSGSASYTDWYVNPYVKVPAGGLTFWAGFKVLGDTRLGYVKSTATKDGRAKEYGSTMEWSVPIGISVGF